MPSPRFRRPAPPRILCTMLLATLATAGPASLGWPPRAHAAAAGGEDADFMQRMAARPGVKTLPSGLEYEIVQSGDPHGTPPAPGDQLVLNYEGKLSDGAIFDSTEQQGGMAHLPFQGLIPGWMEGLRLMRPGDIWMLYIPSRLGYGAKGQGPIPPNAPLIFRIELVAVHHGGE